MAVEFRSTKLATFSLLGISALYLLALIWMLYISIIVGKLQNIFAIVLWLSLILWCARSLNRYSNRARKWSVFLFFLHGAGSLFYLVFPLDFGDMHTTFIVLFIIVFLISSFGIFHSVKARNELMGEILETKKEKLE